MTLLSELKRIDDMHDAGTITQAQHDKMSANAVKKYQPTSDKKIKKVMGIAIIALLFGLLAFSIGGSIITNESIFQIEINNTNLAPSSTGHTGTGERTQGITYYANETPIQLFVFSHANQSGQNSEIHLLINNTKVADTSGRPLEVAEESNKTIIAMIPRYASYMIEVSNYHHYEWREYRILSGQNGSTNISNNYYNISGGADNASLNLKVNKSGDIMTGNLTVPLIKYGNEIINLSGNTFLYSSNGSNIIEHREGSPLEINTNLDMQGNNITSVNTISVSNGINMTSSSITSYYRTDSYVPGGVRPSIFSLNISNVNGTNNASHIFGNSIFRSDFGDIRVKLDNNTDLPYWIEPNLNSINATLWINNTANGTVNIYYGNSTDTSLSNGTHTFNDFSDFETDLNGWSGTRSTVEAYNSTYSFIPVTGSYLRDTPITFPLVYTAYVYFTSVGNIGDNHIQLSIRNSTLLYEVAMGFPTAGQWSYRNGSGGFVTTGISATSGTWHKINVVAYVNATYDYYVDNSLLKSGALALFQVSSPKLNTYRPAASTTYLDNIYIYQYPLLPWAAWGTPQQQQTSPSFALWCVKVNPEGSLYTTSGAC